MVHTRTDGLLLGEWACLGALLRGPAHGYHISVRLGASGDIGRVWSLSRPLTYRALDQLIQRGFVEAKGEEKGQAGGKRTILALTRTGRAAVRHWLHQPVSHLRDVRDELLVKVILCDLCDVDAGPLLHAQVMLFAPMVEALGTRGGALNSGRDPVDIWRYESSRAVLRFLRRLQSETPG
jgi:DNA-binding PadR family transcriptional regulator